MFIATRTEHWEYLLRAQTPRHCTLCLFPWARLWLEYQNFLILFFILFLFLFTVLSPCAKPATRRGGGSQEARTCTLVRHPLQAHNNAQQAVIPITLSILVCNSEKERRGD